MNKFIVRLFALVVVLVVILFVVVSLYKNNEKQTSSRIYSSPHGTLFVSMAKEAPEGFVDQVSMYSYVPETGDTEFHDFLDLGPIPTLQTKMIDESGNFFFTYYPRLPLLTDYSTTTATDTVSNITDEGVSLVQVDGTESEGSVSVLKEDTFPSDEEISNQIEGVSNIAFSNFFNGGIEHMLPEDNTLTGERYFDWNSEKSLLAFAAQDVRESLKNEVVITPETGKGVEYNIDWNIYTVNVDTKELKKIANGLDPQWLPSGSMIFLGTDGIYQYWPDTGEVKLVVTSYERDGVKEDVYIEQNMNMDLSPDGSLLVVSSPNQQALLFFDVLSWEPLGLQLSQRASNKMGSNKQYYWPTFSPDGEMLAVQVTDRDDQGEQVNARIEFIELATGAVEETISLDGYDFQMAFIDDWSY